MKRIDLIYHYLQNKVGEEGITASALAEALTLLRSNVSRELNTLHRRGLIEKLNGRPVIYRISQNNVTRELAEELQAEAVNKTDEHNYGEQKNQTGEINTKEDTAFSELIGAKESLQTQVEQAKAAVIYPPNGLHTLIVGQTGVGKTLLAHMMFNYGKEVGTFASNAPFVTFNCADYYNNPQLLISHIFGHVKGAFTGADRANPGLIEMADQGILFLDEIHRLPPEGQEMIFYFMDTGTFNRLGETKRERQAKVLIIGATTENPESVLTKTFQRRIPNIINIPPLAKRSLKEKLEILTVLFTEESRSIQKPVKVAVDAVKALIGSIGSGNVGQLKSNIRLLCAQAFLNALRTDEHIEVTFQMLPAHLKSGILAMNQTREDLALVSHYIDKDLYLSPSNKSKLPRESEAEPFNLYQMVANKVNMLKREGIEENIVKQIVVADVNSYVKTFYNQKDEVALSVYDRLLKIIDADMVSFAQKIVDLVAKDMKLISRERMLYAFGLHLSSLLNRTQVGNTNVNLLEGAVEYSSLEYKLATKIKALVEDKYNISIAKAETEYFAMLLQSMKQEDKANKVVIVVAMHGEYTASSMVNVARKLFSANKAPLLAFDMPLECPPDDMLNQIVEQIQQLNCQEGVLLLADMGSLCSFGPILEERLNVPVKTIGMVSTPFVLEAMRKVDIAGMTLSAIYDSLVSFNGYQHALSAQEEDKDKVIVTVCSTGQGTAEKLQSIIVDILMDVSAKHIRVIPISLVNMDDTLKEMQQKYNIIAIVGIKDPKIGVPFIPLEELIVGQGDCILREIIGPSGGYHREQLEDNNTVLRKFCEDGLQDMLLYLNPKKVVGILMDFVRDLEKAFGEVWDNPHRLHLIIHVGCALERMVTGSGLVYDVKEKPPVDGEKMAIVKAQALRFKRILNIELSEDEMKFIVAILTQ